MSTLTRHSPHRDITLDDLESSDQDLLERERVVVIDNRLAAGFPASGRLTDDVLTVETVSHIVTAGGLTT